MFERGEGGEEEERSVGIAISGWLLPTPDSNSQGLTYNIERVTPS